MCLGRTAVVQQLWRWNATSPFPPSGNEGYLRNRDVPFQSVMFDVTSVTDELRSVWKMPLLLTPSSALRKPASPPTPVGAEDRTGLRQRNQPLLFRTVGLDNTGKAYPRRGALRNHILRIGGNMWKLPIWTGHRAVLHMEVPAVDSARLG